jgi:hypothetical protein
MGENRGRNLTYRQKNGFLKGRISHHKIRKLKTAKYLKISQNCMYNGAKYKQI